MSAARPTRPVAVVPPPAPALEVPEWPNSLLLHSPTWPLRVLELALEGLMKHEGSESVESFLEPLYVLAYDARLAAEEREELRQAQQQRREG